MLTEANSLCIPHRLRLPEKKFFVLRFFVLEKSVVRLQITFHSYFLSFTKTKTIMGKAKKSSSSKAATEVKSGAPVAAAPKKTSTVKKLDSHKRKETIGFTDRGVHRMCRRAGIERNASDLNQPMQALARQELLKILRIANTVVWYNDRKTITDGDIRYACRLVNRRSFRY